MNDSDHCPLFPDTNRFGHLIISVNFNLCLMIFALANFSLSAHRSSIEIPEHNHQ